MKTYIIRVLLEESSTSAVSVPALRAGQVARDLAEPILCCFQVSASLAFQIKDLLTDLET